MDTERTDVTLPLANEQSLLIEHYSDRDVLRVRGRDGQVFFAIHLTSAGPLLRFEGSLMLEAAGDLALSADRLALHGRAGLALTSGGDARIEVAGDLHSHARIQNITADLGNVNVKANDDVRLDGERVLVNCVDT